MREQPNRARAPQPRARSRRFEVELVVAKAKRPHPANVCVVRSGGRKLGLAHFRGARAVFHGPAACSPQAAWHLGILD